jgi:DNA primase
VDVAGRILKEDVEALRQQADIVAVVGDHTTLKRAGKSFKGLCPFHTEKTPSFSVTPDGNFFHCFGCGASGDIYDFLIRIEGLEFPEAVESLARRVGYTLRYEQLSTRERHAIGERSRLVAVTAAARDHLHRTLLDADGEVARAYLRERGFGREDAERFTLGFATQASSGLTDALTKAGFEPADLVAVGLSVRTDTGRLRDRFRGRLIFPIEDASGDVIGFGGRVLPDLDYGGFDPPKYLNSPETVLYKKTRVLYGLPQARPEIVRADEVLICEGYTDVLALHQAGIGNALATCGTAVGDEHLRLIARYARRVVLAFDGDEAGVRAAERAWEAARKLADADGGSALELRVLVLDEGMDPADLVREVGAEGLREAVDAARPIVPFVVGHHLAGADLATEAGRTEALRAALEVVGREPDHDLRREWARTEVADRIGVAYDFVARTAERMGIALDAHAGVATLPAASLSVGSPEASRADANRARRERGVLRVALQRPELLPDEWFDLAEGDFEHPRARALWRAIEAAGGVGVPLEDVVVAAEDDEVRALVRAVALEDDPELESVRPHEEDVAPLVAAERVRRLAADRLAARERQLRDLLARLHHGRDGDEVRRIQAELIELQRRRRELVSVFG